jgi:hypothetical protein
MAVAVLQRRMDLLIMVKMQNLEPIVPCVVQMQHTSAKRLLLDNSFIYMKNNLQSSFLSVETTMILPTHLAIYSNLLSYRMQTEQTHPIFAIATLENPFNSIIVSECWY